MKQTLITGKTPTAKTKEIPITFGDHSLKLKGKVILPDNASIDSPVPGALLCHGFGASRKAMESSAKIMVNQGIAVMVFDFRGHGDSEGAVDGKMVDDVLDAWNTLKRIPEIDKDRMGIIGHSLGAMSAIMAADKVDPRVLVALSCPSQVDKDTYPDMPDNFGQWGHRNSSIMDFPRQGAFPWLKGTAAFLSRIWMYTFGYRVRVDLKEFFNGIIQMNMIEVLQKLDNCFKLFVYCEGDSVTPYNKCIPVYQAACEPKLKFVAKGGFHTTPLMRGQLRSQWTSWVVTKLTD
jgi:pimeloyl-ACP methyl ester carboxylesterase